MLYRLFKAAFIIFLTANIILYSDRSTAAALSGLNLWLNVVVPSLFPFMVLSSWLSFNPRVKGSPADKISLRLFGVPAGLFPIFFVSILAGYPVGAKITSKLLSEKQISKDTSEHLLSFCNNCGAVFIASAVSSSMLNDRTAAIYFIVICIASSLITGIIYNLIFPAEPVHASYSALPSGKISIFTALSSAVSSVLLVGGCIIFFSVVTQSIMNLLTSANMILNGIISGILEFTQGIKITASSGCSKRAVYSTISGMLCWGGLSVHLQSAAIIGDSDIDLKKYIVSKAFCAATGYFLSYFSYNVFFKSEITQPVFGEIYLKPPIWAISSILAALTFALTKVSQERQ
ncbi:sporulation integral membrane protein YlbJ [Clostridiales bacterium]|nr:sporulation integral membrane protein YlbJ [Clostridiales bacterium]